MTQRSLKQIIPGRASSDGAGVRLTRSLGSTENSRQDPFLMLDEFGSDQAQDYIAGFPSHPHRGFETVTYMLDGEMLHEDHMGNRGRLGPGGVQWMTAGRGIIHSEMPQQEEGLMRGFQLWINLPASKKMCEPTYREFAADEIPRVGLTGNGWIKVIAGKVTHAGQITEGPVRGVATDPVYLDIALDQGQQLALPLPSGHNALIYVYQGSVSVAGQSLPSQHAGLLSDGDEVTLETGADPSTRLLLMAARPIGEPIVQHGPFVMNTYDEIRQAIRDFQTGRLTG
ncbi:MAG: pirin family protein [Gammaproteobacteria bacterium]|nr:pirin family protein [Gammaproteobacteria bacterium]